MIMLNKKLKIAIFTLPCLLFTLSSFAEIVMLKSKDYVLTYELAADGFKSVIDSEIAVYDMEGKSSTGRKIIERLVKKIDSKNPPSAVITIGKLASELACEEISDVPVIFCMVGNHGDSNLIGKKNVGGVSFDLSATMQLTRMKDIIPSVKNIGVIYDPDKSAKIIEESKEIAPNLGINIIAEKIDSPKHVPHVLRKLIKNIDLLWIIPDSTVLSRESFHHINLTALKNCIPVMSCAPQLVEMGSPFSFSSDSFEIGVQAGNICKKVLNGEITGNIPIEKPKDMFLAINLITLKRCGIKLSKEVEASARYIYK